MSRRVLDGNYGDTSAEELLDYIVAQNPQLNAEIKKVHDESNVFLCKILRIYPYEDKALVKILDTGKNIFCRLSHEIMGREISIDYLPNGKKSTDTKLFKNKEYITPYDNLYGVIIKVRWENLTDENVLISYVNFKDNHELKSDSEIGEINVSSGSSSISIDDDRINITSPALFINGLPYEEPKLKNYYDKKEADLISNTLNEKIENLDLSDLEINVDSTLDSSSKNPVQNKAIYDALNNKVDKVNGKGLSTNDYTNTEKDKLNSIKTVATTGDYNDLINKPVIQNIDLSNLDVDVDIEFTGVSGRDETITINAKLIQKG